MKPQVYNILSCIYAVFRPQYVFHFQNTAPVPHNSLLELWRKRSQEKKKSRKLGLALNPPSATASLMAKLEYLIHGNIQGKNL